MGDVLNGEFENSAKWEHRIWLVKRIMGLAQTHITAERENKSVF